MVRQLYSFKCDSQTYHWYFSRSYLQSLPIFFPSAFFIDKMQTVPDTNTVNGEINIHFALQLLLCTYKLQSNVKTRIYGKFHNNYTFFLALFSLSLSHSFVLPEHLLWIRYCILLQSKWTIYTIETKMFEFYVHIISILKNCWLARTY